MAKDNRGDFKSSRTHPHRPQSVTPNTPPMASCFHGGFGKQNRPFFLSRPLINCINCREIGFSLDTWKSTCPSYEAAIGGLVARFASHCLGFGHRCNESMVEQKLLRGHQAPEHVLESDPSLNLVGLELADKLFQFIIGGVARQGSKKRGSNQGW